MGQVRADDQRNRTTRYASPGQGSKGEKNGGLVRANIRSAVSDVVRVAGSLHTIFFRRDSLLTENIPNPDCAVWRSGLWTAAAKCVTSGWLPLPAPAYRRHSEDGGGRASSCPLSAPTNGDGEARNRTHILVSGSIGKNHVLGARGSPFVNPKRFRADGSRSCNAGAFFARAPK